VEALAFPELEEPFFLLGLLAIESLRQLEWDCQCCGTDPFLVSAPENSHSMVGLVPIKYKL
jgi:hypothetical protein